VNALAITIPVTLLLVIVFVVAFVYAVRRDQFDDLVTPAHRILLDDDEDPPGPSERKEGSDAKKRTQS
jgi:cbb3-type cytochrome oxidase maturation protein